MDKIELFKALSNKTRLEILIWLKEPALHFADYNLANDQSNYGVCVGHIQKKAGLTQSTISDYLSTLNRAGFVTSTRVGQWTYYKRNEETFESLSNLILSEL